MISPSKLGQKRLCPKFDYKSNAAVTDRGTLLHEAFASGNTAGLEPDEAAFIEAARFQVDGLAESLAQPVLRYNERKVRFSAIGREGLGGTLDLLLVGSDGRGIVYDLKTGPAGLPDDADDSFQVIAYMLGAYEEFPHIIALDGMLGNPRTRDLSERIVTSREDIPDLAAKVRAVVDISERPFSLPTPGSHCKNCANIAECPAMSPTVKSVGRVIWPLLPSALDPANIMITPEERAVRAVLRSNLENWCEAVKNADNLRLQETGEIPPGFRRIDKSNGAIVPKESREAAINALIAAGIAPNIIAACSKVSFGDLVDILIANGYEKDVAKETVYGAVKDLTRSSRSTYLMRDKKTLSDSDLARLLAPIEQKGQ